MTSSTHERSEIYRAESNDSMNFSNCVGSKNDYLNTNYANYSTLTVSGLTHSRWKAEGQKLDRSTEEILLHRKKDTDDKSFGRTSSIGTKLSNSFHEDSFHNMADPMSTSSWHDGNPCTVCSSDDDDGSCEASSFSSFDIDDYSLSSDEDNSFSSSRLNDGFETSGVDEDSSVNYTHYEEHPSFKGDVENCPTAISLNKRPKRVNFSTVTIRTFHLDYKFYPGNPALEKCKKFEKSTKQQLLSSSTTKKKRLPLDKYKETPLSADLTLDLRDYEWTRRNRRRRFTKEKSRNLDCYRLKKNQKEV